MEQIHIHYYKSPVGELILGSFRNSLCLCDWRYRHMRNTIDKRISTGLKTSFIEKISPLILEAQSQLEEYFQKKRCNFTLPLNLMGSPFQKQVWEELINIKHGETISYKDLARKIQKEKAVRAVASANRANALSIFIPCHRVIGSNGQLTGYAGGLNAKKKLLTLEMSLL